MTVPASSKGGNAHQAELSFPLALSFLQHGSLSDRTSKASGVDSFSSGVLSAVRLGKDLQKCPRQWQGSKFLGGLPREPQPPAKFIAKRSAN